jgi:sec-independent protein translocase protein TatA
MFNLGGWEWVILLVIVLIVFGVGRLPEIGGAIGKSIREFRESSKEETTPETPAAPTVGTPAPTSTTIAAPAAAAKEEPTSEKPA